MYVPADTSIKALWSTWVGSKRLRCRYVLRRLFLDGTFKTPSFREQPFDFYGGGAGRLRKKKIPALILGEKMGRQKKFSGLP